MGTIYDYIETQQAKPGWSASEIRGELSRTIRVKLHSLRAILADQYRWQFMNCHNYLALRRRFQPQTIELAVVAESPPASGRYFTTRTELAVSRCSRGLMKQLRFLPSSKGDGLAEFQRRGLDFGRCNV